MKHVKPFLSAATTVLDIGAGACGIAYALQKQHYAVTALDVKNLSFFPEINPVIYTEGSAFPFPDKSFEVALLLTVLHHCTEPEQVLREAKRVAHKLIVMEDIYHNFVQKQATYAMDSLVNLEFLGHPHNNKTATAWENIFYELDLHISYKKTFRRAGLFRQVVYVLEN
ncbi:MAG: class I SAM-dependent methyltransferase [Chitinophagales bacterium]|nr:class I SAM-dependent methyltransferase [Chitinophagales bacterium]